MRATSVFAGLVLLSFVSVASGASISQLLPWKGANKDSSSNCATCTVALGLLEQLSIVNNQTISQTVADICDYFPDAVKQPCQKAIQTFGPYIIKFVTQKLTPDEVCLKMSLCKNAQCHLFPRTTREGAYRAASEAIVLSEEALSSWSLTPWDWLKKEIDHVFNTHEPLVDLDGDLFSTAKTFRGSSWRGKDCNDLNKKVYAGRKNDGNDPHVDGNCNGIFGLDPNGVPYEELFCNGTRAFGAVILGDSAAAHFHIPPEYLSAPDMNKTTYNELLFVLENEFDWPEQSSATAYVDTADRWDQGPLSSLYKRLLEHNRCNHRDYQNIAVNGARVGSMNNTIIRSFARDIENDKPAIVFHSLIGNDVCSGHPDYWNSMTTPEKFYASVVDSMTYLDSVLPEGSHVVFTGLADGRILYNTMSELEHPVGGGVKYVDMYDWMNCLEISPCLVWMNSNSTIRDAGSARAAELNQVYSQIIANHTFQHFDMHYYDLPIEEAMSEWVKQGGQPRDLIEPVDGFHPSQVANSFISDMQWKKMMTDFPDWLGPANPHNDEIKAKFGDQGGY